MPLFVWKKEYSVGVELLDEHHKNLFGIFNSLYENTMHSKEVEYVLPIIDELQQYTRYHFIAEEKYMREQGFSGTDDHILKHEDFAERINNLYSQYRDDDLEVTIELIVVLGNWLLHHVLEEDRKYSKIAQG
ncbi:MAG: hypothetical protein A2X82_13440 [Geobacteraceae bacterium GWC2_55_20]|nr:MAG: hypothetical protein A2X82_13440 [Geobacteraceae bacterium GWC2_55_20]OGU25542.1 MAG: hypothetical protein A2X85_15230 [Geobacteraceae bacterium GWF2_54_21]HBA72166.1 bacteriohemerythrin [Geobacter sp.]HCE68039.1 bacteriohemerythrin [Geobacter sp.]